MIITAIDTYTGGASNPEELQELTRYISGYTGEGLEKRKYVQRVRLEKDFEITPDGKVPVKTSRGETLFIEPEELAIERL